MKKITLLICVLCGFALQLFAAGDTLIGNGKLTTALNGNGQTITNSGTISFATITAALQTQISLGIPPANGSIFYAPDRTTPWLDLSGITYADYPSFPSDIMIVGERLTATYARIDGAGGSYPSMIVGSAGYADLAGGCIGNSATANNATQASSAYMADYASAAGSASTSGYADMAGGCIGNAASANTASYADVAGASTSTSRIGNRYSAVADLPASSSVGTLAYVYDALSPSYLQPVVGGGAVVCPLFFDGTNWVCH